MLNHANRHKIDLAYIKNMPLHSFDLNTYHFLIEKGLLGEDERKELIEGRIIEMSPIGTKHASVVKKLLRLLIPKLQNMAVVSAQDPISLTNTSEPEPDIVIAKYREDFYAAHHPTPEDILLIIEVADTSLDYDREVKIPLYAKSMISEVWLINLIDNNIEIYKEPLDEKYHIMTRYYPEAVINPLLFPDLKISLAEILGIVKP